MLGKSKIRVVEDESYAPIASEYQYRMLACLNEALASNGIEKEARQKVMEDFSFDFGILHDQGEIKQSGSIGKPSRQFEPIVGFLEGKTLYIGTEHFQFHEFAHANTREAIKAPVSQLVSLFHREKRFE